MFTNVLGFLINLAQFHILQTSNSLIVYSLVQYWWYLSQAIVAMKLMDARTAIIPWKAW